MQGSLRVKNVYKIQCFLEIQYFPEKFVKNKFFTVPGLKSETWGIVIKFRFWYWGNFSELINFYSLWNHQKINCFLVGFLIILGGTEVE